VTDDQGNVLTGRPITYATDNPAVATVSNSGLVTGVALGSAKITATSEGKTGTADVTVVLVPVATVDVTPPSVDLDNGQSGSLVVVARDAKGNVLTGRPVAWTSGAPSVASVAPSGVVTGVGAGSTVVFAPIEGKTGSSTINVRQLAVTSVTVAPPSNNINVGAQLQLSATVRSGTTVLTDRVVGWSSSNEAVAVVSSTGRVTGIKAGAVTITATSEGVSGTAFVAVGIASVVVTGSSGAIIVGQTKQLTATARDAANATVSGVPFTWSSASTAIATVNATGLVTGRGAGTVNNSAAVGTVSGAFSVTVNPPPVDTVTVTPATANVSLGVPAQLTATLKDANGNVLTGRVVTWTSSNQSRASVSSSGLVVATVPLNKGTVTITATSEGKSGTSLVTVQ
jgi:uncharacterized protein YjdB